MATKECMVATLSDQGTFVRLSLDDDGTFRVCLVERDGDKEFEIAKGKDREYVCDEARKELRRASEIPKLLRLQ